MTTTVDEKQRAVIPFKPGDVLEVEQPSPDVVVLKRTKAAESARPKLVRRNGRLVFVGEPHGSGHGQDGVVNVARRVGDAGADVLGFQAGEVGTGFRP